MNRSILSFFSISIGLILLLTGTRAAAKATCQHDLLGSQGTVIVGDFQAIKITGLEQKGIQSGTYYCRVIAVGPGVLATQSQLECEKRASPAAKISGWMVEGLDHLGRPAASIALYDENGGKIYESPCSRN